MLKSCDEKNEYSNFIYDFDVRRKFVPALKRIATRNRKYHFFLMKTYPRFKIYQLYNTQNEKCKLCSKEINIHDMETENIIDDILICFECLDAIQKPLKLKCNHVICVKCASKCSLEGINECPLCRYEQELDENKIMENIIDYKQKYQSWRKGKSKGAKDMENIRRVSSTHSFCNDSF